MTSFSPYPPLAPKNPDQRLYTKWGCFTLRVVILCELDLRHGLRVKTILPMSKTCAAAAELTEFV